MSFVDTNVLVHATAKLSAEHARARAALVRFPRRGRMAISRQVLREYLAVMTRPQSWGGQPVTVVEAMSAVERFEDQFRVWEDGPNVWKELATLSRQIDFGGKQVHDANIVATMLAYNEQVLLTFNAAHFRRFTPFIEVVAP